MEVVVTIGLIFRTGSVEEAVEMVLAIGIEVSEKIIIENTFKHGMLFE